MNPFNMGARMPMPSGADVFKKIALLRPAED